MERLAFDKGQRGVRRGIEHQAGLGEIGEGHRRERGDFGRDNLPERAEFGGERGPASGGDQLGEDNKVVGRTGGRRNGFEGAARS